MKKDINMATQYKTFENEKDWLQARTGYITSTEVASLIGKGKYSTYFQLWHDKKSKTYTVLEPNDAMLLGKHCEAGIAKAAGEKYGFTSRPFKDFAYDDDLGLAASFDEIIETGEYEGHILEIKKVSPRVYSKDWCNGVPPIHIELQVQTQMMISGIHNAVIIAAVDNEIIMFEMVYSEAIGQAIKAQANKFWQSIEDDNEPEPDYRVDADYVIGLSQSANDDTENATDEHESLIIEYLELNKSAKEIKQKKEEIKAKILSSTEAKKLAAENGTIDMGVTKDNPGELITPEMVGQRIGAKKGFRRFVVRG